MGSLVIVEVQPRLECFATGCFGVVVQGVGQGAVKRSNMPLVCGRVGPGAFVDDAQESRPAKRPRPEQLLHEGTASSSRQARIGSSRQFSLPHRLETLPSRHPSDLPITTTSNSEPARVIAGGPE